jgi:hypothetical protein
VLPLAWLFFLGGRDEKFQTVLGDTSNDAVISLEHCQDKVIEQITEAVAEQVEIAKKHQHIRLEHLTAASIEIPKISFDYQVIDNFALALAGAKANFIAVKPKQIPLWGIDPRHLSFKFNQYKNNLDFTLKYRADIYTQQEAEYMMNNLVTKINMLIKVRQ